MTEHRKPTNPLMARRAPAAFTTDLAEYCAWLNSREPRRGEWRIVSNNGTRTIDWVAEVATDDWLREKGLAPQIGKAA